MSDPVVRDGHGPFLLCVVQPSDYRGPRALVLSTAASQDQELKQATEQMQLGPEFSTHAFGFDR